MSSRKLLSIDAFAKTVEDARIKTASGGIITLVCVLIALFLIRNEYQDYTTIITRPELVVDRDINTLLDINLDVLFPNVPCDLLSLDFLDELGQSAIDVMQNGFEKFRLTKNGKEIKIEDSEGPSGKSFDELTLPVEGQKCESCYGALKQDNNERCCNSCEAVKVAYAQKMWGFYDGSNIEQCEREGYVSKISKRVESGEGCRVKGSSKITRISGTMDFAPGTSFTQNGKHTHDLSLFVKHTDKFNFDHTINHLSFGNDPIKPLTDDAVTTHPLDSHSFKAPGKFHFAAYYLKVVATRFEYMNGPALETNQFSVITHDRPIQGGTDQDHVHTLHARGGTPGVSFFFDISPLKIINREQTAKPWLGFVLGVVSSIAGVLMVGSLLDRLVYSAQHALLGKKNE